MSDFLAGVEIPGFGLGETIGSGGMGRVFLATEVDLGRTVALKVIRTDLGDTEEMRQRFILEARTAAAIEHPNVVPIYTVGQVDGLLYISMRFIDGPSLADVIQKEVFLEPERAVSIIRQIASALEAAHEIGFVHRDVKPSNILLATHGSAEHAYLADFGLARFIAQSGLTRAGEQIGTPSYMSPEQVRGEKTVDGRADIYALGCVLHETLTGETPFPREEMHAIYFAHLEAEPPRCSECNSSVSRAFDDVVARALAKDPEDRFTSASELADACTSALGEPVLLEAAAAIAADNVPRAVSGDVEPLVLLWQLDPGGALIHRHALCPALAGTVVPPSSIAFAGQGTAGWMRETEAHQLSDAAPCGRCMT